MTFKTYNKIKVLGYEENIDIFTNPDDEIFIEEKVDGCFNYNTKIDTNKGKIPIGEIVNKKLDIKVLSMNLKTKELEYKTIKKYYKHGLGENWTKLGYNYFGKKKYLVVTDNHNIFTNNGLKKIKEINICKDKLICCQPKLTNNQKDVLIGSILGDGSFRNMNHVTKAPLYSETHSIKQKDYLKYKKGILKKLISKEETFLGRYSKNHIETEKIRIYSYSLYTFKQLSNFYVNNKKSIPNNIIKYLSPMTLAIWYMDNGSCHFSNKQSPRAKLHMQGFSEENIKKLSKALNKLGILNNIHNYKGWQIDINAQGTKTFFKIISSYIHPSMNYKISKEYRTNKIYSSNEPQEYEQCNIDYIISFSPLNKQKYDLEIEDNHNYFTKGILVHNSNFRFMINESGEVIFGSRSQELTPDKENKYAKNFERCINHIRNLIETVRDVYPNIYEKCKNKIYYGECMVAHTIHYDWTHTPIFLGFDVYDIPTEKYLKEKNIYFDLLMLDVVPHIKTCKVSDIDIKNINDSMVPISKYISPSAEDTLAEGIVFKNYEKQIYARIDKTIFKLLDEGNKLGMELMSPLLKAVYKDIWEESWEDISLSKKIINLNNFKKLVSKRCLEVLKQVIQNNIINSMEKK